MMLLANACDIYRDQTVGTNGRTQKAVSPTYSAVSCLVLPMNHNTIIQMGFSLGKAFDFYFDLTSDVRTGDKLAYNGKTYYVKAVQPFNVPGVGHLHCMTEEVIP